MSKEKPAYVRDSEWEIARSLANLWAWSQIIECSESPKETTYYVANENLAFKGATRLNGKRIVVTIKVEPNIGAFHDQH